MKINIRHRALQNNFHALNEEQAATIDNYADTATDLIPYHPLPAHRLNPQLVRVLGFHVVTGPFGTFPEQTNTKAPSERMLTLHRPFLALETDISYFIYRVTKTHTTQAPPPDHEYYLLPYTPTEPTQALTDDYRHLSGDSSSTAAHQQQPTDHNHQPSPYTTEKRLATYLQEVHGLHVRTYTDSQNRTTYYYAPQGTAVLPNQTAHQTICESCGSEDGEDLSQQGQPRTFCLPCRQNTAQARRAQTAYETSLLRRLRETGQPQARTQLLFKPLTARQEREKSTPQHHDSPKHVRTYAVHYSSHEDLDYYEVVTYTKTPAQGKGRPISSDTEAALSSAPQVIDGKTDPIGMRRRLHEQATKRGLTLTSYRDGKIIYTRTGPPKSTWRANPNEFFLPQGSFPGVRPCTAFNPATGNLCFQPMLYMHTTCGLPHKASIHLTLAEDTERKALQSLVEKMSYHRSLTDEPSKLVFTVESVFEHILSTISSERYLAWRARGFNKERTYGGHRLNDETPPSMKIPIENADLWEILTPWLASSTIYTVARKVLRTTENKS